MKLPYARRVALPKNSPEPARWTHIIPPITVLILMVLSVLPSGWLAHLHVTPLLAIMGVYFWSIHKPEALPLFLLFFLGMANDLLTGEILMGLSSFVFVAVGWGISRQYTFFRAQNFLALWLGFAVLAALVILLQNILTYLLLSTSATFSAAVMSELLNAAIYPLVAGVLQIILRGVRITEGPIGFPSGTL